MAGRAALQSVPSEGGKPLISFIIPAYNDAVGLARHFRYFASRSEDIELVLVDDCSTDDTADVIKSAKLPENIRLKLHLNARNAGAGPSRNSGLELASGRYLMFLDADDLLSEHFFDYLALSPLQNGADFVLFKYHLASDIDERHSYRMHLIDSRFFSGIETTSFPARTFALGELPSAVRSINFPWNKIYDGDFLRKSRIRFPDYRMHEDIYPHWKSFLSARRFGILDWAPPLLTHFEAEKGSRATNYVGEQRMQAFATLKAVHDDIATHRDAALVQPEFVAFCEDIFAWLVDLARQPGGREAQDWAGRYRQGIKAFWPDLGLDPGKAAKPTRPGQILVPGRTGDGG